jgi:hypothetical protein
MREIRTSGSMSGEGRRTAYAAPRPSSTLPALNTFHVAPRTILSATSCGQRRQPRHKADQHDAGRCQPALAHAHRFPSGGLPSSSTPAAMR